MSHTSHIEVEMTDLDSLEAACKRLNLQYQRNGSASLYDGTKHKGFVVHLKDWSYPIIINGKDIAMDNYNGHWGSMDKVNELKMYYGVEKTKKLARRQGYMCRETMNGNKPQVKIYVKR